MIKTARFQMLIGIALVCSLIPSYFILKKSSEALQDAESESPLEDEKTKQSVDVSSKSPPLVEVFHQTNPVGPAVCKCIKNSLPRPDFYMGQIYKVIPWLNITTLQYMAKYHPNYPATIMPLLAEGRCKIMPEPNNIAWSNTLWQEVSVEDTTFFLYSAFLDNRPLTDGRPCIRILAHSTSKKPKVPWCHLWYNNTEPPIVSPITIEYFHLEIKSSKSIQMPLLMTCSIPPEKANMKPMAVSVVAKPCDHAKTLMEVTGAMERNPITAYRKGEPPAGEDSDSGMNVAACGTLLPYYHEDFSTRLVEWLEILKAMGFSKVFLLHTDVHPNITKVLQHYEDQGFVGVTNYNYPEPYADEPSIRRLWSRLEKIRHSAMSIVYSSDCVLRHMHEYRFIANLDPDEMPMLPQHDSYTSWMDTIIEKAAKETRAKNLPLPASYAMYLRHHVNNLPPSEPSEGEEELSENLWILRHTKVLQEDLEKYPMKIKSLYDTDTATVVAPNNVSTCGSGKCPLSGYSVPESEGYIGYYNGECAEELCLRPGTVEEEKSLLRYTSQVKEAVSKVLTELKLV